MHAGYTRFTKKDASIIHQGRQKRSFDRFNFLEGVMKPQIALPLISPRKYYERNEPGGYAFWFFVSFCAGLKMGLDKLHWAMLGIGPLITSTALIGSPLTK
jgi:hypothetical protein